MIVKQICALAEICEHQNYYQRNGEKHLIGVVQEGVSEMMEEGWTRKRFRKERMMCKCRKGGGRAYFFMVLFEGRGLLQLRDVVLTGFRVGQKLTII